MAEDIGNKVEEKTKKDKSSSLFVGVYTSWAKDQSIPEADKAGEMLRNAGYIPTVHRMRGSLGEAYDDLIYRGPYICINGVYYIGLKQIEKFCQENPVKQDLE